MKNLFTILERLKMVIFTSYDSKSVHGTFEGHEVEVSYRVELAKSRDDLKNLPLQMIIQVRVDGQCIQTWGCESDADHMMFIEWYYDRVRDVNSRQDKDNNLAVCVGAYLLGFKLGE